MRLAVVASPFPILGGGAKRSLESLLWYRRLGFDVTLILPPMFRKEEDLSVLARLKSQGIRIIRFKPCLPLPKLRKTLTAFLHYSIPIIGDLDIVYRALGVKDLCATLYVDLVLSHHELPEHNVLAIAIARYIGTRSCTFLQLPPFYGIKIRKRNIDTVVFVWRKLRKLITSSTQGSNSTVGTLAESLISNIRESVMQRCIRMFDAVIAASKSIPIEMGDPWPRYVYTLDPAYSMSQEHIDYLFELRYSRADRDPYVIYAARATPQKGILDALLTWRIVRKSLGGKYKLIICGKAPSYLDQQTLFKLIKYLGLSDSVVYLGPVDWKKLMILKRRAKLMLYPSHVDSYSLSVAETLLLGTPVACYDIPALKIYHGNVRGTFMVKESDIEALAQTVIELLESRSKIDVGLPKLKPYSRIFEEEVTLLKRLAEH